MYAVIEAGGKQFRVEVGTELEVDLLDAEPGQSLTLERVLLVGDGDETAIGRPVVTDAAVEAEVVRRDRADKLIVFKYRPKARRRVRKGHRQDHTVLRITDVRLGSKSAAEAVRKAEQQARGERKRLEEAAARQAAEDAALAARLAKAKAAETPETKAAASRPARSTSAPAPKGKAAQAVPAKGRAKTEKPATAAKPAAGTAKPAPKATAKTKAGARPTAAPRKTAPTKKTDRTSDTKAAPKRARREKDE